MNDPRCMSKPQGAGHSLDLKGALTAWGRIRTFFSFGRKISRVPPK